MNKSVKIGLVAGVSLIAVANTAWGAAACTSGAASSVAAGANFIKSGFTPKCSKNVNLDYLENATQVGVCSGSTKGNKQYGGTSEGGGVTESTAAYTGGAVTATTAGC